MSKQSKRQNKEADTTVSLRFRLMSEEEIATLDRLLRQNPRSVLIRPKRKLN